MDRRTFLGTTAAMGAMLSAPAYLRRAYAEEPLKVGSYGGYFESSLKEFIYPLFTKESGIEVQSIGTQSGPSWLASISASQAAGDPPVDVTMAGGGEVVRFAATFEPFDAANIPHLKNLPERFINLDAQGRPYAAAVLSWFATFVQNTDYFPDPIASWSEMWDGKFAKSLGCTEDITISYLLDITATVFFGGQQILGTREGILQVMAKAAELQKSVTLWYRDEGQFQQGLQSGEIPAGVYYHDATQLMIADGFPVMSVFPKEGGIVDFGAWGKIKGTRKGTAVEAFVDFCFTPQIQGEISRKIGTAPIVSQEIAGLSDEEFAKVSSPRDPILPNFKMYVENADWLTEEWTRFLTKS